MFDFNSLTAVKTQQDYQALATQMQLLVSGEDNLIANLSNISAMLNEALDDINWVGFYLTQGDELVLGPFQGKIACIRIPIGRGVCGTAASTQTVLRIEDVEQFEGHIACDSASRSEIVLPIVYHDKVVGVLDIDSPSLNRFSEEDHQGLVQVMTVIEQLNWASHAA